MSTSIPPLLVCSTPPPIDFDNNDDDFSTFETADGNFHSYDGK